MMRCIGYAYPWDYADDAAAADRAAGLGLDAVAVAASYHATRAASPLHPRRRVFEVDAACYVPVRQEAWRGRGLVPVAAAWDPGGESFAAHRELTARALEVDAWIVLSHNAALGGAHRDLVIRGALRTSPRSR